MSTPVFEKCPKCGHEIQVVKFEHVTLLPTPMPESELVQYLRDALERANADIARMRHDERERARRMGPPR